MGQRMVTETERMKMSSRLVRMFGFMVVVPI